MKYRNRIPKQLFPVLPIIKKKINPDRPQIFLTCDSKHTYIFFWPYTYTVINYQINLHSLRNRLEKLIKGLFFYLYLKLVQINCIFSDTVRMLYIPLSYHNIYTFHGKFSILIQICHIIIADGAVMAVIVWSLDLRLPLQSVPITDVVSLNLDQGEVYKMIM